MASLSTGSMIFKMAGPKSWHIPQDVGPVDNILLYGRPGGRCRQSASSTSPKVSVSRYLALLGHPQAPRVALGGVAVGKRPHRVLAPKTRLVVVLKVIHHNRRAPVEDVNGNGKQEGMRNTATCYPTTESCPSRASPHLLGTGGRAASSPRRAWSYSDLVAGRRLRHHPIVRLPEDSTVSGWLGMYSSATAPSLPWNRPVVTPLRDGRHSAGFLVVIPPDPRSHL